MMRSNPQLFFDEDAIKLLCPVCGQPASSSYTNIPRRSRTIYCDWCGIHYEIEPHIYYKSREGDE